MVTIIVWIPLWEIFTTQDIDEINVRVKLLKVRVQGQRGRDGLGKQEETAAEGKGEPLGCWQKAGGDAYPPASSLSSRNRRSHEPLRLRQLEIYRRRRCS